MAYRFCTHRFRIALGLCIVSSPCLAQISLDGSLGGMSGDLAIGGNNEYTIDEALGSQVGSNLFHSFGDFNVNTGETATFTGSSVIENILSRVTGGAPSNIDGTLGTDFPNATPNLYLLNPAGILFGTNASLDVQGSFHATTADYIGLQDGTRFNALPSSADASLTTAPPAAFGFLGENPAGITVQGSLVTTGGETLSVVSGDLQINAGTLATPNGRINIASVGSAGEVVPSEDDLNVESIHRFGEINITQQGALSTSGTGGGAIFIRGGRVTLDGGQIDANTLGDTDGQGIDIQVDRLTLSKGGQITASALGGSGDAGNITVDADEAVSLSGQDDMGAFSEIATLSGPLAEGDGGRILVKAPLVEVRGGFLRSTTSGNGDAGVIELVVDRLTLAQGQIASGTLGGTGQGGEIIIDAAQAISISGEALPGGLTGLLTVSLAPANKPAGRIFVKAPVVDINGGIVQSLTNGDGDGGAIEFQVERLVLRGGAQLDASTQGGEGQGGAIIVKAAESIDVSGQDEEGFFSGIFAQSYAEATGDGGRILLKAPVVEIDGTLVDSRTSGDGNAGTIEFRVDTLNLREGAFVFTGTLAGSGQGGEIIVNAANSVSISGKDDTGFPSTISALTQAPATGTGGRILLNAPLVEITDGGGVTSPTVGGGDGGVIEIQVDRLSLARGGAISTTTVGGGDGGKITLNAKQWVDISGQDDELGPSGVFARSRETSSDAGDIAITTESLVVRDNAVINASTSGSGRGGNVAINATNVTLQDGGNITARSTAMGPDTENGPNTGRSGNIIIQTRDSLRLLNESNITVETDQADGGDIAIESVNLVYLLNSEITTSVQGGAGDGGNISIDPQFVVLDESNIIANAFGGSGGNINIATDFFIKSPDSAVSASSALGVDGEVVISSPETDLVSSTLSLPAAFLDATSLLSKHCTPRTAGRSSFIVTGRREAPPGPETRLPGHVFEFPKKTHAPRGGDPRGKFPSTPGAGKRSDPPLVTQVIRCNFR